ncbi:hypothetical protein Tco_1548412 [Tanacetum coccineum]
MEDQGNGSGKCSLTDTYGGNTVLPPRTVEETLARERERKARTILALIRSLAEDDKKNFAFIAYGNSSSDLLEALKEKDELKTKVENWHSSYKNLGRLLNTQMSANDKFGLGFVTSDGMHVVPPPMTGNYMPSGPDVEIDDSKFTYGPKQPITSESETNTSDFSSCESESSVESLECLPEQVVKEPKVTCEPKVWTDAPIIEEYEQTQ